MDTPTASITRVYVPCRVTIDTGVYVTVRGTGEQVELFVDDWLQGDVTKAESKLVTSRCKKMFESHKRVSVLPFYAEPEPDRELTEEEAKSAVIDFDLMK